MKMLLVSMPGDGAAGQKQARDVGLERLGIERRHTALVEVDAGRAQQVRVGSVARQQQDGVRRQLFIR